MDFNFSSEQEMLRKSVAEFLKKECPFETVKEIEDSQEGYSPKLWKKMAKLEWMGICFPEEYGGFGDPLTDLLIVMEEMGKRAFPSPFFSTVIECGLTIMEGGSEKQKKDLLGKIAAGKMILGLARYEEDADYHLSGINMQAVPATGKWVLNGTKLFVNDANIADKLLVIAKTESGLTFFIVDTQAKGIKISRMPSIAHENTCEVVFENVTVSEDEVLGAVGKGEEMVKKVEQKILIAKCAGMLGGCLSALEMTTEYAKTRVQYGTPIGGNQIIQHYLADMKLAYDSSINFFHKTAWMIDQGIDALQEASALKAYLNESYNFITDRAVQIFGGVGTTREFDIGLFFQKAKASELTLGDTEYHYEQVAQSLGL